MSLELVRWLCRKSAALTAALLVVLPSARAGSKASSLEPDPIARMHARFGFVRAWLLVLGVLSASSAMAVNSYPAKWRFLDVYGVNRTGYASCNEAGNAAMAIADRYYAPRVNVITNDECPPPSNEVYWSFRQTDDFPTSSDDIIYMCAANHPMRACMS